MADPRELAERLEQLEAAAERLRQERRARPAYADRWLGWRHDELEAYARRLLAKARPGTWLRFYAADADDAAGADQIIRYIVRQERPAESVRVEWLRRDGSWRDGFPRRPADRSRLSGRGSFPRELRGLARVESQRPGDWWFAGRLRLGPKRGTVAPLALPRPSRSAAEVLGAALEGRG